MMRTDTLLFLLALALAGPSSLSAQVALQSADSYAALGGPAVTCTDSVIVGDLGVATGGTITRTNCTITGTVHEGDAASQQAYYDFIIAYGLVAQQQCDVDLTGQSLAGMSLTPGVYCFDAAQTETGGLLTLVGNSNDSWLFKIGVLGTGALTATNFTVVMPGVENCNNNVTWWTSQAATLTDTVFIGTILSGAGITITRGSLDGQALATDAVTMTGTEVSVCEGNVTNPPHGFGGSVTGGGQIPVPNINSKGQATFGFNARAGKNGVASGHFNYVNHTNGLHVNGKVDQISVIAVNPDGSPRTIRFSGVCNGPPGCTFSVTVEDHGEPGRADQFGVRITGSDAEVMSQRVISKGNIKFHAR